MTEFEGPSPTIAERLATVRADIEVACRVANRSPNNVTLIAVSKGHPAAAIRQAYEAGQRVFGENYPAEFRDKAAALADLDITWHFIGHCQRNKIKWVAPHADAVHTLHDTAGIQAWQKRASSLDKTLDVLLQVNIANEASKRGCTTEDAPELAALIRAQPHLRLRGLMTLPPAHLDPSPYFRALSDLQSRLDRQPGLERPALDMLSIGMSGDFPIAIAHGATHVRVGTAIFGPRR